MVACIYKVCYFMRRYSAPEYMKSFPQSRYRFSAAFSLLELLVVIAVVVVMMTLAVPAFNSIKGGGDITKAAYDVAGALEAAGTYARANNTYVWVGFFEEDSMASAPTAGVGRLVISIVASKDGTQILDPNGAGATIPPDRLVQIGKLIKINGAHFGDVPDPVSPDPKGAHTGFDQRPSVVTANGTYRIGGTTPPDTVFPFQYPVGTAAGTARYTFHKTIRFSPQGEAVMNTSLSAWPWLEIGLQPARGNVADTGTPNIVAIQVAGINPHVRIFRR